VKSDEFTDKSLPFCCETVGNCRSMFFLRACSRTRMRGDRSTDAQSVAVLLHNARCFSLQDRGTRLPRGNLFDAHLSSRCGHSESVLVTRVSQAIVVHACSVVYRVLRGCGFIALATASLELLASCGHRTTVSILRLHS
jgi:hypothetical protein